jgi:hypothetical protein
MTNFDFNSAGPQKSFEIIPANSIVNVELTVKPGAAGDGGWLRRSRDGTCEMLDCEFTVIDGEFAGRKIFQLFTVGGTEERHVKAAVISAATLRAALESARAIGPGDESDAAQKARQVAGWQDFDCLRFMVRLGVKPPQDGYEAKNTIKEIITPDRHEWKKPEQVQAAQKKPASSTKPPANPIARPDWAR